MTSLSLNKDIPFYPTYETEVQGHVTIWWFVKDFSQSRFNFKNISFGSNACTIITVLLAARCHYEDIKVTSINDLELNPALVCAFAESILEGNDIHETLRTNGSLENVNLTVPEAIQSAGKKLRYMKEWKSVLYMVDLRETLFSNMKEHVSEWYTTPMHKSHPNLYVILIADHRSVLFVFQDEPAMVTIMDSHQHMSYGALIAQVYRPKLKALCNWFSSIINIYFDSQPDCYELTFLYFQK